MQKAEYQKVRKAYRAAQQQDRKTTAAIRDTRTGDRRTDRNEIYVGAQRAVLAPLSERDRQAVTMRPRVWLEGKGRLPRGPKAEAIAGPRKFPGMSPFLSINQRVALRRATKAIDEHAAESFGFGMVSP
jgi:hypothetical protein